MDATTIVSDPNQFGPTFLDVHLNPSRESIDAVLKQFFDDAGWPFNDLTSGDLVDDRRVKLANARHGSE